MTTIQKLNAYGAALSRWKRRGEKKKDEPMPTARAFDLNEDDPFAIKVREQIFKEPKPIVTLEEKPKIKIPARRTI